MRSVRTEAEGASLKYWPVQVLGGKYVRLLEKELRRLRGEEAHGNRRLFLDDVFVAYLLAFFNPTVRSLRTVEDFSQTVQAQKHLSLRKICRSTLSDFNRLADPERLVPILAALRKQLDQRVIHPLATDSSLGQLVEHVVAVDGSYFPAVAEVVWAVCNTNHHGAECYRARVDVHLTVGSWLPEVIVVPEPHESEADSALAHVEAGRIYLYDRGFMSFALLAAHYRPDDLTPRAHLVARYRPAGGNSPALQDVAERTLTDADRAAGILSDRRGYFVSSRDCRHPVPRVPLREVLVRYEQEGQTKTLRLITNLLEVSAQAVATLYRQRWQVELFFRWLKSYAHFGHLISHSREGVQMHFYVTIVGVLLMYLHTGYRPSKYLFALLGHVAAGAATLEEILPILRERERQCELARASAARRRAKHKSQNT